MAALCESLVTTTSGSIALRNDVAETRFRVVEPHRDDVIPTAQNRG